MRMAKPSERDIDAAGTLMQLLDTIDRRWGGPMPTAEGPEDLFEVTREDGFDEDNPAHLQAFYNHVASLMRKAPNFHGRVIGGMCYVICWNRNEILDPADDFIEKHPDIIDGLSLLAQKRADFLPRLEREARAAVADVIELAAARHLAEMAA